MSVSCSCHKIKETPTESYRFCSSCNHQWADLWQDVKDGLSSENLIEYKTDHQFRDLVKDNIEIVFCERFCLYGQKLNNRHRVKLGSTYVKLSQNRQPHICLMGDYQRDKRIVEFMKYFCRFCLFFKLAYHPDTMPKKKRGGGAVKKIKLIPELLNTNFFRMSHKDEVELARQIKEQYTDFIKKRASVKINEESNLLKRKIGCQPLQEVEISSSKLSNEAKISF